MRLETDAAGRRIAAIVYRKDGAEHRLTPKLVILSAGAVHVGGAAAALGGRTQPERPRQPLRPGRPQFHEPQLERRAGRRPAPAQHSVYQKTIGFNDFYLGDGEGGAPLGNVQLLGRVTGADPEGQHAAGCRNGRCSIAEPATPSTGTG